MANQDLLAILKKGLFISLLLLLTFFTSISAFSQTTYTIYYTSAKSGLTQTTCDVFANSPTVESYVHNPAVGGVEFDGTNLNLETAYVNYTDANGNQTVENYGTVYQIQFPFKVGYSYQIQFVADQSGGYGINYPLLAIGVGGSIAGQVGCGATSGWNNVPVFIGNTISNTSLSTITLTSSFTAESGDAYLYVEANPYMFGSTSSSTPIAGAININEIIITETQPASKCTLGSPIGLGTTNNTQTLTWTSEPTASSYNLVITDTHNGTPNKVYEQSSTNSYHYCALGAGDNVSFTVQGVCASGSTGAVSAVSSPFTAVAPVPSPPTYNTTTNVLSWPAISNATGYTLQLTDITAQTAPVTYTVGGTSLSANSLNLISDHAYQAAVNSITCYTSAYSSVTSFTVPCLTSTIGTTEQNGQYSPVWVYYEQINTAVSYSIRFTNTTTGVATTQSNLAWYGSGYQFSISPGTYQVAVQTVNALCTSNWETYGNNVTVVAGPPECTPAPSFAAVETAGTSIKVYWNQTSGATSYNLKFVNITTGGTFVVSNLAYSSNGYTYSAIAGDTYGVYIESNCSAGNSGWVEYSSNITVEATARSLVTGQNNAFTNAITDPSRFRIFPVPASGVLNLIHNADGNGDGDLSVINTLGSILMVKQVGIAAGQNNYSLDVSKLPSGVYIVKLFNGKAIFLEKLIIQR